jgi:hypothetical protein
MSIEEKVEDYKKTLAMFPNPQEKISISNRASKEKRRLSARIKELMSLKLMAVKVRFG